MSVALHRPEDIGFHTFATVEHLTTKYQIGSRRTPDDFAPPPGSRPYLSISPAIEDMEMAQHVVVAIHQAIGGLFPSGVAGYGVSARERIAVIDNRRLASWTPLRVDALNNRDTPLTPDEREVGGTLYHQLLTDQQELPLSLYMEDEFWRLMMAYNGTPVGRDTVEKLVAALWGSNTTKELPSIPSAWEIPVLAYPAPPARIGAIQHYLQKTIATLDRAFPDMTVIGGGFEFREGDWHLFMPNYGNTGIVPAHLMTLTLSSRDSTEYR